MKGGLQHDGQSRARSAVEISHCWRRAIAIFKSHFLFDADAAAIFLPRGRRRQGHARPADDDAAIASMPPLPRQEKLGNTHAGALRCRRYAYFSGQISRRFAASALFVDFSSAYHHFHKKFL